MFTRLLLLFIIVPAVELALLIKLGQVIGVLWTLLIIILTGVMGASFAKQQGLMVLSQIRGQLNAGIMPSDYLIEGLLILGGSLFLLTPGIITDLAGFLTLIPASRGIMRKYIRRWLEGYIYHGSWRHY